MYIPVFSIIRAVTGLSLETFEEPKRRTTVARAKGIMSM
jgi:hypothetical protein